MSGKIVLKAQGYVRARMRLDVAMAEFFSSAQYLGIDDDGIIAAVLDSLFDGSNGTISAEAPIDNSGAGSE